VVAFTAALLGSGPVLASGFGAGISWVIVVMLGLEINVLLVARRTSA
jgi:hypothetical protein